MEAQAPVQPTPKKNNLPMMLGIGAAVLVCCCLVVVAVIFVFTILAPSTGKVFSQIEVMTPIAPDFETPFVPVPQNPGSGDLPQGGITDDLLRANTWPLVQIVATAADCSNPSAADTTIEVTQPMDANGVWKELWTVACESGSPAKVEVTFTPGAQGGTDVSVSIMP